MPLFPVKAHVAEEVALYLEKQAGEGKKWVVYELDHAITGPWDLRCFASKFDALDYEQENSIIWDILDTTTVKDLLYMLKQATLPKETILLTGEQIPKKDKTMNLNNLENLKGEMKTLGFKDKLIEEMEKNMEKSIPDFQLQNQRPADKGQVDFTLHFKKSGQSDFYYFNKYEVALNKGNPLDEGQKYMVISPGEKDKPVFRTFESPNKAIAYLKEQKGNSELALGKDPGDKTTLATMENGKVNYVSKEFNKTYYSPPVSQVFYVEKGRGFTAEQAANLVQGRSVYRDDLLNVGGIPYKAWIKLDFDKPKDRHQNFTTNQYHDPSYGFDLKKVLDKFYIKELSDPAKREKLEDALKNGNRPLITTQKNGQEIKLLIEAVPRYGQINMFAENGKPEKREQFLKEPALDNKIASGKGKGKEKAESQGVKI